MTITAEEASWFGKTVAHAWLCESWERAPRTHRFAGCGYWHAALAVRDAEWDKLCSPMGAPPE